MEVTFIGTGLMGAPMAERLLEGGIKLTVYNRTTAKTTGLAERGAHVAATPAEAMLASDTVILMLTDSQATDDILLRDQLVREGQTIIQMSTIAPDESVKLARKVTQAGARYLEAPVLGSIPEAESGRLFIIAGGEEALLEEYRDVLLRMGREIIYAGETGKAFAMKLALNQLIAALTAAFSVSLGLVREYDLDVEKFMGILRNSALYAPTFDKKLDRMLTRDFSNPNFPAKHLLKDVDLMVRTMGAAGLNIAPLLGVREVVSATVKKGDGDSDYSAIYNAIHGIK
jgi:3-hydroxyisobutyrate dehydrogenase